MSTGDSEGPAWNKFWLSLDQETESMVSGEGSHRPHTPGRSLMTPDTRPTGDNGDSVLPNDSASHNGNDSQSEIMEPSPPIPLPNPASTPFPFKFKAPSGRVHRLQISPSAGLATLLSHVTAKLGPELSAVGGEATFANGKLAPEGFALSYLDNEGDSVSITTDQDLLDAISLARAANRDKVDLFVHDPRQPPLVATVDPRPGLPKPPVPSADEMGERRRLLQLGGEDEPLDSPPKRERERERKIPSSAAAAAAAAVASLSPSQAQIVPGLPNEVLLPGAIVTLAVVIIAVFSIGRASGGR